MQGNLQDMAVADLIQQYCQDQKTARLTIERNGDRAELFIKEGGVVHAVHGDLKGEQAVFHMLLWEEGAFNMESGVETSEETIKRSWSGLLMEGMRFQDEERLRVEEEKRKAEEEERLAEEERRRVEEEKANRSKETEDKGMAENLNEILKEMSGEVAGYISSALVGLDGLNIADHANAKIDLESSSAQMSLFLQQVDSTVKKLEGGVVEEDLLTTERVLVLMRFLSSRQFFLLVQADRKTGNLGNLRMITKVYANRLEESMPNNPKPKSKPGSGPEVVKSIFSFP